MTESIFSGSRGDGGSRTRRNGLYLAAFLDVCGVNSSLSEHGGVICFEAPDDDRTRNLVKAFRKDGLVPVLQFMRSLQKMRSRRSETKKHIAMSSSDIGNKERFTHESSIINEEET